MGTTDRKLTKITDGPQGDLFGGEDRCGGGALSPAALRKQPEKGRVFVAPDPHDIYLGSQPLKAYLKEAGIKEPLTVRRLLQEQDWAAFTSRYASTGRAPYAPSAMMGLILYGILQGVTSLRGLERLARRDVGCMWVTGGICPDHANIGRFINLHHDLITGSFFETLTRSVLKETGSAGDCLAGDGTVVEAAASHYDLLKAEAASKHADAKQRQAQAAPENADKQRQAEQARQAQETLDERIVRRRAKGKPHEHLCISAQEPEAMVQPLKRGRGMAPSYKPSILANEARVVVGHTVHPSAENAVLPDLLGQSQSITGYLPKELLLDAGYHAKSVIETCLESDIGLLCPEGRTQGKKRHKKNSLYSKSDFRYDEFSDCYHCPAGAQLIPVEQWSGNERMPGYTSYGTSACAGCEKRGACTRNVKGRRIKRYEGDTAKDALRQVMQQPGARRSFSRRQAMVEPVFSVLRGIQGLNRFRRKGLAGAKTEFALHVLAYNLGRVLAWSLYLALLRGRNRLKALFGRDLGSNLFDQVIAIVQEGKAPHAIPKFEMA